MKLSVHRYAEDFLDDSDYTEEQLDTNKLKDELFEIAQDLPENKSDAVFSAIKLIERLEWIDRVLLKEIER